MEGRPGLRDFHALLGGGLLAFEWGGGGLNTLLNSRQCTFNLGARGGLRRARKLGHASKSRWSSFEIWECSHHKGKYE